MAKLSYLEMVNRILKRITQAELSSGVSSATGHAAIIAELINEAQTELWTETTNWYSLYKQRIFETVTYTATTIAFNDANPDTITDSASGMGSFQNGQTVVISGSTSNDKTVVINTAAADKLTLQTADALTAEAAGASVTLYAVTYPVATDWGRAHYLVDYTNNIILREDASRSFDEVDPDMDAVHDPTHFSLEGDYYRLHYIPTNAIKIIDRYWAVPTVLSADADTTNLPLFCENFIIHWAWMSILEYLNKFEAADRLRSKIYGNPSKRYDKGILEKATIANKKIIDNLIQFNPYAEQRAIMPPRMPSTYGVY